MLTRELIARLKPAEGELRERVEGVERAVRGLRAWFEEREREWRDERAVRETIERAERTQAQPVSEGGASSAGTTTQDSITLGTNGPVMVSASYVSYEAIIERQREVIKQQVQKVKDRRARE